MLYFNLEHMVCYVCNRQFSSENALLDHLKHNSAHSFCGRCTREFRDEEAREQHYQNSSAHRATYCDICQIDYDDEEDLKFHRKTKHGSIYCDRCDMWFRNSAAYKSHQRNNATKHFLCQQCTYDSPSTEDRARHWETSHKHTYCKICSINWDNVLALENHRKNSPYKHHICVPCNRAHTDHTALVQHWTTSPAHKGLYDNICNKHFESETANWAHKASTPTKHFLCKPCRLDFPSREAVTAHWQIEHKDTYDSICDMLFDTPLAMWKHMRESTRTSQHGWCEKCSYDLRSLARLRAHWESDIMHFYTYCQDCQHDYEDASRLQQHLRETHPKHICDQCGSVCRSMGLLQEHILIHHPTPIRCFFCNDKEFPTHAAVFEHIESEICESADDVQILYGLLAECPDAQSLVIRSREPFLRAGPPRRGTLPSDFEPRKEAWKCPYCKVPQKTAADLTHHLQAQNYSFGYPTVVKCSGCDMRFKRLSALFEHLETTHAGCEANTHSGAPDALVKYLQTECGKSDDGLRHRFGDLTYGLRTDPLRPGMLYVKVTSNIAPDSERVPL